ncbi:MAG TPA: hypothetical protein VMR33_03685 [Candidatus Baltobacteraceae bacterium]|jgi:hypothetical protein|nr:hypothetical protein [Candidatus Baltobacteraceae bacterium]
MTIDAIKEAVHAEPFRHFRLRLAGGPVVNVAHPDYIAFGPKGRTIVVYRDDDTFKILDTLLITEIAPATGSSRKR